MPTSLILGFLAGVALLSAETAQAQRANRAVTSADIQKLANGVLGVRAIPSRLT